MTTSLPHGFQRTDAEPAVDILSLPKPPAWVSDALCAQVDNDGFFPEKNDVGGAVRAAKKVCSMCPVTEKCLEYALDNEIRHGIWGGVSDRARLKLEKARAAEAVPS